MPKLNIKPFTMVFHGKTYSKDTLQAINKLLPTDYTCKVDLASPNLQPSPYLVTVYRDTSNIKVDEEVLVDDLNRILDTSIP